MIIAIQTESGITLLRNTYTQRTTAAQKKLNEK